MSGSKQVRGAGDKGRGVEKGGKRKGDTKECQGKSNERNNMFTLQAFFSTDKGFWMYLH